MAILSLLGGLTFVSIAAMWLYVRLLLNGGKDHAAPLIGVYRLFVAIVLLEILIPVVDGVIHWLTGVWNLFA